MALIPYSQQDEFDLVNSGQDIRGYPVVDSAGNHVGTVQEMIIDTEAELVTVLVLDSGAQIPARNVSISGEVVTVSGMDVDTQQTRLVEQPIATETRASTASAGQARTMDQGEVTLPVIEEEFRVGKRTVETGGVRVHTRAEEVPLEEQVQLREESVHVERRPANRLITNADTTTAFTEGVIEVTGVGEEAVVGKQARVVEEVVIGKETVEREEVIRDTVRRTDVEVERLDTTSTTRDRQS